jgi:triacylglycerol lipase
MDRCKTKYPILMVHGTGFRDSKYHDYWGRIPKALEDEGATIFYGEQDGWGSIETNAQMLKDRITELLASTGYEKVNIIAHSKGGMDARYAISSLDMAEYVASLTTISTLHHGSKAIDLACSLPQWMLRLAALISDPWLRARGDKKPDFYRTIHQFTTASMAEFNRENRDAESVYYQSYATVMKNSFSDMVLFLPHMLVHMIEGESDGLVTPHSATWTNFKGILRGSTRRGVSHADAVDGRRKNLTKKAGAAGVNDIREVYIEIAEGLKNRGL